MRKEKEDENLRMQKEADSGAEPNSLEPLESGSTVRVLFLTQ